MINHSVVATFKSIDHLAKLGSVGIVGKGTSKDAFDNCCRRIDPRGTTHYLAIEKNPIPMGKNEEFWIFPKVLENSFRVLCKMPGSKLYGIIELVREVEETQSRWW